MPLSSVFNTDPAPQRGAKGDYVRVNMLMDPDIVGRMQIIAGQRTRKSRKTTDLSTIIREAAIIYLGLLDSLGSVDYEVGLQAVKEALSAQKTKIPTHKS